MTLQLYNSIAKKYKIGYHDVEQETKNLIGRKVDQTLTMVSLALQFAHTMVTVTTQNKTIHVEGSGMLPLRYTIIDVLLVCMSEIDGDYAAVLFFQIQSCPAAGCWFCSF